MKLASYLSILLCGSWILPAGISFGNGRTVTVYSARKEHLIQPVFREFTKQTGIEVAYVTDKAPLLLEKIRRQGQKTAADILLTVDAGNLWQAAHIGILDAVNSPVLMKNIPSHLRDPDNRWFGFSVRARTIVYQTKKVSPDQLSTYEALADEKWRKKLCLRTAKKVYNQSLVAMFIADMGVEKAEKVVRGWVSNLATKVFPDDTSVLKALASGQCDVGIVNTYYLGRLLRKNPNLNLAIFWPNQKTTGVHVNVSGGGIVKHSKNKDLAKKLLEWLSSQSAQGLFAGLNLEYPANPAVMPDKEISKWGKFMPSQINISNAGEKQVQAIKLMDRANYR